MPSPCPCRGCVAAYRQAIKDAVEAVSGILHWSEGDLGLICNWNKAVAAVEALEDKR